MSSTDPAALAAALAAAVLLAGGPRAIRLQKELIRKWEQSPLAAAIAAGIDTFAEAFESDEPATAMRRFRAERAARKARPAA